MEHKRSTENKDISDSKKRDYRSPSLVVYGKLRHLTQASTSGSSEGSQGTGVMKPGSDRSIKENVVRVGEHPLGIGLYLFDYKPEYRDAWGHGRQFGVMAQEVETVMPEAVSVHPDGYKLVDHVMLGISRTVH